MKPDEQIRRLKQKINDVIKNAECSEFFKPIPDMLRARVRAGFGITAKDSKGKLTQLDDLAESTIIHRERLERRGLLSSETAPMISNQTESGNMLDSIIFKKNGNKYEIGFDNRRKKNGVSPEQIKDYNEDNGRLWFGLTADERDKLQKNVGKKIEKEIGKLNR